MTIVVCPLSHVETVVRARAPSHMITLLDPSHELETPKGLQGRHLRVGVNDICEPTEGLILADVAMVERLVEFGREWPGAAPLLVHCWAGISRSTATAFILACERNPEVEEARIARTLREASPTALPNRHFVALADDILGRRGRMVDAIAAIGPGQFYMEGQPFDLPIRFDREGGGR